MYPVRESQDRAGFFLNTGTSAAELCRKHDVSPVTLWNWKDTFMGGGKQARGFSRSPSGSTRRSRTGTSSPSTERSSGSMYGPMSLPDSKMQRWCWPEHLQTTTATGYTRLWGTLPQTSLSARRRMGMNEERNHSKKDAKTVLNKGSRSR